MIRPAHYKPEWPSLWLRLFDYESFMAKQKRAQFAQGINDLNAAIDITLSKIDKWSHYHEITAVNLEERVSAIADMVQSEGVSLGKLPAAIQKQIDDADQIAFENDKARRFIKYFDAHLRNMRKSVTLYEEGLLKLDLGDETMEMREILAGMNEGASLRETFERVKRATADVGVLVNHSHVEDELQDLRDIEDEVAADGTKEPKEASLVLALLRSRLAQAAPLPPVKNERVGIKN